MVLLDEFNNIFMMMYLILNYLSHRYSLVGFDPTEGSTTAPAASNSNRIPSNQSQSVFTGPVAAGAFTGKILLLV